MEAGPELSNRESGDPVVQEKPVNDLQCLGQHCKFGERGQPASGWNMRAQGASLSLPVHFGFKSLAVHIVAFPLP